MIDQCLCLVVVLFTKENIFKKHALLKSQGLGIHAYSTSWDMLPCVYNATYQQKLKTLEDVECF